MLILDVIKKVGLLHFLHHVIHYSQLVIFSLCYRDTFQQEFFHEVSLFAPEGRLLQAVIECLHRFCNVAKVHYLVIQSIQVLFQKNGCPVRGKNRIPSMVFFPTERTANGIVTCPHSSTCGVVTKPPSLATCQVPAPRLKISSAQPLGKT